MRPEIAMRAAPWHRWSARLKRYGMARASPRKRDSGAIPIRIQFFERLLHGRLTILINSTRYRSAAGIGFKTLQMRWIPPNCSAQPRPRRHASLRHTDCAAASRKTASCSRADRLESYGRPRPPALPRRGQSHPWQSARSPVRKIVGSYRPPNHPLPKHAQLCYSHTLTVRSPSWPRLGDRLTVGQRTLTPPV